MSGITTKTYLDRLYALRARVDEEIAVERARLARIQAASDRIPPVADTHHNMIVTAAAEHYGLTTDDLTGSSRSPHVTDARAVASWVARQSGMSINHTANLLDISPNSVSTWAHRMRERPDLLAAAEQVHARLFGATSGQEPAA